MGRSMLDTRVRRKYTKRLSSAELSAKRVCVGCHKSKLVSEFRTGNPECKDCSLILASVWSGSRNYVGPGARVISTPEGYRVVR